MGRYINRTPKRHILGWKDVIMTYRSWCVRPVHMMKKPKKTERNLTVAYWVFGIHLASDHPRRLIEIQFVPENSGQMVTLHSSLTYTLSLSRWDRVWKSYNQKNNSMAPKWMQYSLSLTNKLLLAGMDHSVIFARLHPYVPSWDTCESPLPNSISVSLVAISYCSYDSISI